jgi:hypothetical protein
MHYDRYCYIKLHRSCQLLESRPWELYLEARVALQPQLGKSREMDASDEMIPRAFDTRAPADASR